MIWPATYLGFDVLPVEPNRATSMAEGIETPFEALDNQTGGWWNDQLAPAALPARPFSWLAFGEEEIEAMLAWLDARHGRAVPFWLPSWQADLQLLEDVLEGATSLAVAWVRYATHLYPSTGARRHIAILSHGENPSLHHVSACADPGDGERESLTISPVTPFPLEAQRTRIFFLKLCRLEEDLAPISWPSSGCAEAIIQCREIPAEAPE
jgi:hypothetical protein